MVHYKQCRTGEPRHSREPYHLAADAMRRNLPTHPGIYKIPRLLTFLFLASSSSSS